MKMFRAYSRVIAVVGLLCTTGLGMAGEPCGDTNGDTNVAPLPIDVYDSKKIWPHVCHWLCSG